SPPRLRGTSFFRADKLLEEEIEKRFKVPTIPEAERTQLNIDLVAADAFSKEDLGKKLKEYGIKAPETGNDLTDPYEFIVPFGSLWIKAPETGNDLTDPYEFNLMFPTPIGPSGLIQFNLMFPAPIGPSGLIQNSDWMPFGVAQNSDRMPFGVAQVGKSYRNEIAPRGGLVRQREFTQAEIEFFCKPGDKPFEKFASLASLELQ
ncbi:hypothetical protein T484DRAFT_1848459, partial [Baffinella frigidus]